MIIIIIIIIIVIIIIIIILIIIIIIIIIIILKLIITTTIRPVCRRVQLLSSPSDCPILSILTILILLYRTYIICHTTIYNTILCYDVEQCTVL